ncbi:MAG: NAD-dependent epimerase/dehydratase family protein [Verrucomicrobia bacterium]|nr:NAD-dependent epimerase/dehydratase family protein [Verrucomicrobiota bacterium]
MTYQRRILITGGAGNIGGALASRLAGDPENYVVVVDDLSTGSTAKLPDPKLPNWRFIKLDVNDQPAIASVMTSIAFDYVFHYAAVVGVQRTLERPLLVLRDIEGIKNILELSKNTGVRRVFYSSSSEVYGEPFEFPQNEHTTPLNSRLPYAIVKNLGESYFKSYQREFGLPCTIFRFFNTYGPRQSEDFVLPKLVNAALTGKPLTVYGDGSQTRTFCYIDDNIDTIRRVLYEDLWINETANVGSDREVTILELAQMVVAQTGGTAALTHLPPLPEGDMTRRCPDITKMKAILGRNLVSLEDGIERLIQSKRAES